MSRLNSARSAHWRRSGIAGHPRRPAEQLPRRRRPATGGDSRVGCALAGLRGTADRDHRQEVASGIARVHAAEGESFATLAPSEGWGWPGAPAGSDAQREVARVEHRRAGLDEIRDDEIAELLGHFGHNLEQIRTQEDGAHDVGHATGRDLTTQLPSREGSQDVVPRGTSVIGPVIGSYRLVRKLGEGGMGAVYLGQHQLLGRHAAIKVLLPGLSARPDIVSRFFNEARAVTSIRDPGIVQVFDFGYHTDGSAFIVMEYLDGEPLDRRLARLGRLPVRETMRLARQLAISLAATHAQHIVHRDLKPENVFLVPDAEVASGERSKILDFGIAKLSDEHPETLKTHTGTVIGTPVYMSPEQCRGLASVDHRSDIYALGCVLFHLLTGRPPFEGEAPGDIMVAHVREPAPAPSSRAPDVPPSVDALVLRCLAKAPADRFQSMGELTAAVAAVLSQLSAGRQAITRCRRRG